MIRVRSLGQTADLINNDAMDTRIIKAQEMHLRAMAELIGELFEHEPDFSASPTTQIRGLRMLMERDNTLALVAVDPQGLALGMVTAQLLVSTAIGGISALVEDLVVTKARRGEGIGSMLISEVEQWARRCGVHRLQLVMDRENLKARTFYLGHGFTTSRMEGMYKLV